MNGIKIESEIEWLAEHHKYSSFKYNVTKGLQAKFVALHPYRHHWPKVCALKISRKFPLNFFSGPKKKNFIGQMIECQEFCLKFFLNNISCVGSGVWYHKNVRKFPWSEYTKMSEKKISVVLFSDIFRPVSEFLQKKKKFYEHMFQTCYYKYLEQIIIINRAINIVILSTSERFLLIKVDKQ